MSTYVVTGGAGFIGTNLVKQLYSEGHVVKVFDNFSAGRKPERIQEGVEYIEGDIRDKEALLKAFTGVDGVFHTAAIPRMPYSIEHPLETNEVNIEGTLNVLIAARDAQVKRVVYSASSSAYGNQETYPYVETMKAMPLSPYGLQKFVGEEYARLCAELYKLETVSLRYFNVYGPYMDPDSPYSLVIGKFFKQKQDGKPLTICGDGEYYRDFTYVTDVVQANILAMTSGQAGNGEVINIGRGHAESINTLAKLIGGEIAYVDRRPGDCIKSEADIAKAKQLLQWEPTVSLESGIDKMKQLWGVA